jgi:hypothetical protein
MLFVKLIRVVMAPASRLLLSNSVLNWSAGDTVLAAGQKALTDCAIR